MTRDFTVFPATSEYGDTVGEIHAESWKAAYSGFFAPEFFAEALNQRRHKWQAILAEGKNTAMLAALNGRALAFSYFGPSPTRPGSAEIFGFYGHPDGWGTGIANVLMTESLDLIRKQGLEHVHLWTLHGTPQSRRFYTKNAFTESGVTRTHDYGDGNPLNQLEYELHLR